MICKSPALLSLALLALLASPAPAQSTDAAPHFLAADVHPSPHSMYPRSRWTLGNGRYFMRQASLVDLIVDAYSVDPDNVAGGPPWLDIKRFDIYASVPPRTSRQNVRLMLRALLADRFQLVLTNTQKPMPAYVLSVGNGGPKMTAADAAEPDSGCRYIDPGPTPAGSTVAPLYTFSCRNVTMETFAQNLHEWGGDYMHTPVVDSTGLKGGWDFDFKFHSHDRAARSGADGVTIFAAVDKQLGLKLEAKTAPLPVVLVTSVREAPTPNSPDLAKVLPPPPPAEFDVATIRPSRPDETMRGGIHGGSVDLEAGTPEFMITFAYEVTPDMLVDAPKWLSTDHYDVVGKAAIDPTPGAQQIELEDLQMMTRKFLAERFNLKVHTEDRPLDALTLLAAGPRLKQADPTERTGCKEGPGADGKDPRIATPVLGRLMTCRNMTMAQFADQLPTEAGGYVHTPVLDATGLDGAYDFTVSFSSFGQLQSRPSTPNPTGDTSAAAASASDPNGALSLQDALVRQLGLKLVKQKRPVAVLVIDHIDRTPTEN